MQVSSRSLKNLGHKALVGLILAVAFVVVAGIAAAAFTGYRKQIEACEKAGGQWVTETDYVPVNTIDSKGNVTVQWQYVSEGRCVK